MRPVVRRSRLVQRALQALCLLASLSPALADPCCDPNSPFAPGEEFPQTPATCETMGRWADRAPQTDDRFSLGIRGALTSVHFDGTLAYLSMCAPLKVVCITYSTNDMKAGDVVRFAGG